MFEFGRVAQLGRYAAAQVVVAQVEGEKLWGVAQFGRNGTREFVVLQADVANVRQVL